MGSVATLVIRDTEGKTHVKETYAGGINWLTCNVRLLTDTDAFLREYLESKKGEEVVQSGRAFLTESFSKKTTCTNRFRYHRG